VLASLAVDVEHKTAILRAGGIAQVLTVALFAAWRMGVRCMVHGVSCACLLHGA
jgi:hypothetical protein